MEQSGTILLGAVAAVTFSLTGFVLVPALGIQPEGSPQALSAEAQAGREVYRDLGCIYCHTQQIRPEGFGVDQARGWGRRGSLPVDYVGQQPPLLGTMRTGPDLADVGTRQPSETWHLLHLYDPQLTSPGSNMPPYAFLFKEVAGEHPDGLVLPDSHARPGVSVVPGPRARELVAYLQALKQDPELTGGAR